MKRASSRLLLLALVGLDAGPLAAGCGDGEDDCGERDVALQVTVDGRTPAVCASWALEVRACSTGGDCDAPCGPCVAGAPDPACPPVDACKEGTMPLPAGDYQVCVHAELVNGGLSADSCAPLHVGGAGTVAMDVDTDDAFPCIRSWTFDGEQCCSVAGDCVAPGT